MKDVSRRGGKHLWQADAFNPALLTPVVVTFLGMVFVFFLAYTVVDVDLWHEMALAREVFKGGSVPTEDLFAYTPTVSPSVHHEWGAGILAYSFLRLGGENGILALKYLIGLVMVVAVVLRLRITAPIHLSALTLTFSLGLALIQPGLATIRAQMYSFLFTALLFLFLAYDRRGRRWWVPLWLVLFVAWVNLHGGFVVGFLLIGAEWAQRWVTSRSHKRLLAVGWLMAGLVILNPYGFSLYRYILMALFMDRPRVAEWDPIWLWVPRFPLYVVFFFSSALLLCYVLISRQKKDLEDLFPLLSLFFASILCFRLTPFYAIAWTVAVPGWLKETPLAMRLEGFWRRRAILLFIPLLWLSLGFAKALWEREPWKTLVPARSDPRFGGHVVYPVSAVDYLERTGFTGNLMVSFRTGSYVLWRLFPKVHVSVDSRYEVAYPDWLVEENFELYSEAKDWEVVLSKYSTDAVLVEAASPLVNELSESPTWELFYSDELFLLFRPTEDSRRGAS